MLGSLHGFAFGGARWSGLPQTEQSWGFFWSSVPRWCPGRLIMEVQVMLTPVLYSNSGVFLGLGAAGGLLLHLLWPLNLAHR